MLARLKHIAPGLALQLGLIVIAQACSHGKNGAIDCSPPIFQASTIGQSLLHATAAGTCDSSSCPSTGLTNAACKKFVIGAQRLSHNEANGWVDASGNYIMCSVIVRDKDCTC